MKRFAATTKKHISTLISAISEAVSPLGLGIIAIMCDDVTPDTITLSVLEMPTEILCGPMDGAEMFYGFSFNLSPLDVVLETTNVTFIRDDEGTLMAISGETRNSPRMSVMLKINSDAPDNIHAIQTYNTRDAKSVPKKVPSNVLAIIKTD